MITMADESQEEMIVSDNELNVSHSSSQLNQSLVSIGSVESDGNEANDEMNDTKESINSNKSVGSNGKSVTKKRKKLSKAEKEAINRERERRKEEKEREMKERKELSEKQKLEKQKLKDLEKEKKDKERQEKETERLRIKEEKQKEKEEKQKERDLEKHKKEEEILEKRRKLEEEKQRKSNEKQKLIEDEERKTLKTRQILSKFLIKKPSIESNNCQVLTENKSFGNGLFLPFQLGANQKLAQIVPEFAKRRFNRQELDQLIVSQDTERRKLYLNCIKDKNYVIFNRNKREKEEPEVMEVPINESSQENEANQLKNHNRRIKHLQFHLNVRPPYTGTFTKTSRLLKPTKPFNRDPDLFDYDVDSDEDWEEGGPGESLDGSDSDGSAKDDYEIDNEFFVPHGYLSEDENDENDDKLNVSLNSDVTNVESTDDKTDAKEPLLKEQVLMAERNRSFSKTLTPLLIGCVWESNTDNNQKFVESLQQFKRMNLKNK